MATDATGTPTSPDNIPTYNVNADDPTGNGFNAAIAAIQTIITQLKAGTLASGKILPAGISWTGAYPFVNADCAAGMNLAVSKLAPGANTQFLQTTGGVAVWGAGPSSTTYRKTTAKAVNTTIAETDLLNGEITIGAGVMGTTSVLRFTASGDYLNNAARVAMPRLKLKLGATTIFDTGVLGGDSSASVNRGVWRVQAEISNLGATNSQSAHISLFIVSMGQSGGGGGNPVTFTTGEGVTFGLGTTTLPFANTGEGVNTAAVDTTAAQALVLSVINGTSSASYEMKLNSALVEII